MQPCGRAATPGPDSVLASLLNRTQALPAGLVLLGPAELRPSPIASNCPPGPCFPCSVQGSCMRDDCLQLEDSERPH